MMNAGLMTTGLTNCSTGGDPTVAGHLCGTDAAEGARNIATVAEPAASEPNVDPNSEPNSDSWRVEVAARLARYRTRRKPRTPRYPSLLLPFDSPESWSRLAPPSGSTAAAVAPAPTGQDFTFRIEEEYAVGEPTLADPLGALG